MSKDILGFDGPVHYRLVKDYGRFVMWESVKSGWRVCCWPEEKPEGMPEKEWLELRVRRNVYVDPHNSSAPYDSIYWQREKNCVDIPMTEENRELIENACRKVLEGEKTAGQMRRELNLRSGVINKWLHAYKQKTGLFAPKEIPVYSIAPRVSAGNGHLTYMVPENREELSRLCRDIIDCKITCQQAAEALEIKVSYMAHIKYCYMHKKRIFAGEPEMADSQ